MTTFDEELDRKMQFLHRPTCPADKIIPGSGRGVI